MRASSFIHILQKANRGGLAKRVTKQLVDRAYRAVEDVDDVGGEGMDRVYYDLLKPNNQVSDEFRDALLQKFDVCPECEIEPILDPSQFEGYLNSDKSYCSKKCRDDAHDNEGDQRCDWCEEWFNSEHEYFPVFDDYYCCSEECAWDVLVNNRYTIKPFFEAHPEVDEDATLEALKATNKWYRCDGHREMRALLEECAVGLARCAICKVSLNYTEGRWIEDLEEWYCSDQHCWEGIADYLSDRTNRLWSGYQAQQLMRGYVLYELEDAGKLEQAVREVLK